MNLKCKEVKLANGDKYLVSDTRDIIEILNNINEQDLSDMVSDLMQELEDCKEEINDLEQEIKDWEDKADDLENKISDNDSTFNSVKDMIIDIQSSLNYASDLEDVEEIQKEINDSLGYVRDAITEIDYRY